METESVMVIKSNSLREYVEELKKILLKDKFEQGLVCWFKCNKLTFNYFSSLGMKLREKDCKIKQYRKTYDGIKTKYHIIEFRLPTDDIDKLTSIVTLENGFNLKGYRGLMAILGKQNLRQHWSEYYTFKMKIYNSEYVTVRFSIFDYTFVIEFDFDWRWC